MIEKEDIQNKAREIMDTLLRVRYMRQVALVALMFVLLGGAYSLGRNHDGEVNNTGLLSNVGEAFGNVFSDELDGEELVSVVELGENTEPPVGDSLEDENTNESSSDDDPIIATLDDIPEEFEELAESQVLLCEFNTNKYPSNGDVVINEIAWMGSEQSSNDEWIELHNLSSGIISLQGWQLVDKKDQIHVVFDDMLIGSNGYLLLERSDDDSVSGVTADVVYVGSLSNTSEGLRLFDSECGLVDEVLADEGWSAGDSALKRTMQRESDLSWTTYGAELSSGVYGTPRAKNGEEYIEQVVEDEEEEEDNTSEQEENDVPVDEEESPVEEPEEVVVQADFSSLEIINVIYDVEGSDDGAERIEIKNNGSSDIDLSGGSIQYLPPNGTYETIRKKNFESGNVISAGGTFIVGVNCHTSSPCVGVQMSWSQSLGNESGVVYLVENQERITDAGDSDIGSEFSY